MEFLPRVDLGYDWAVLRGRRTKQVLWGLGFILAGALALGLAFPIWFPWLLRPVAAAQGVHYSQFHRDGYSRFTLTDVRLDDPAVKLKADRIEAVVPTVWLWHLARESRNTSQPFLQVVHWQVVLNSGPPSTSSTSSQIRIAERRLATLGHWLPTAIFSDGTVQVGNTVLPVNRLYWSGAKLEATLDLPSPQGPLFVSADFSAGPPFFLKWRLPALHLDSQVRVSNTPSGTDVHNLSSWWSNRLELDAHFGRSGKLPETALLQAPQLHIPPEVLRLPEYQPITGAAVGRWAQGRFSLEFHAAADPLPSPPGSPPLNFELRATGTTNAVTVENARFVSPFLSAEISQPLVVAFQGQKLLAPVELRVTADLDQQSWFPLGGKLQGAADFEPSFKKLPSVRFQLSGSGVGRSDLKADSAELKGTFDWPWLTLNEAKAKFSDGSLGSLTGRLDLQSKEIAAGHVEVAGTLAQRWLPAGYAYQGLQASGDFEGPFGAIFHRGTLDITNFTTPYLQPLRVHADWHGQKESVQDFKLDLLTANSSLHTDGALLTETNAVELQLRTLTLFTNDQRALELAHPFSALLRRSAGNSGWNIDSTPLDWAGPAGQLRGHVSLGWPGRAAVALSIHGVSSAVFAGVTKRELPSVQLETLDALAAWSNGPAVFHAKMALATPGRLLNRPVTAQPGANALRSSPAEAPAIPLKASLDLSGDQNGITISNLLVYSRTSTVVTAQGFLPLSLNPSGTNLVQMDFDRSLRLVAITEPQASLWKEVGSWTGVVLVEPQLKVELAGTWAAPLGRVQLRARQVRLEKAAPRLPAMEDLRLDLRLNQKEAELTAGQLAVQGQPVSLTGHLPLGRQFWQRLRKKEFPDLANGSATVRINHAKLAAFEPLFPNILAPEGQLDLDLSLLPGPKLSGKMRLQNARSRPLGDFGPIRHIELEMSFVERSIRLDRATAEISGSTVKLSGQSDLGGWQWLNGDIPPFFLTLYGTNVPLVRQPEAVIRGDLELAITKTNGAPPLISGLARLHDSFFLADLSALVPGKVAAPNRRPPYFSIEDPFVADWRLAVSVEGARFLKVRTPLFNGEISANLKLQGSLKDPLALGDLRINSGIVAFPFGSLEVRQGLVGLSSQDPYHPQISVAAASKQFGYDIRMEVSGPVDAPVIQFNSTPPLSSEQILLMVTAGQLPQGTFTLTPQQRAQTVALFFGRDLLAKLGVGDQSQQRITVRSGEEISEQGRPTYHVEYKLSNRWSLVGEYDRFGDFNAGFKWRILSR